MTHAERRKAVRESKDGRFPSAERLAGRNERHLTGTVWTCFNRMGEQIGSYLIAEVDGTVQVRPFAPYTDFAPPWPWMIDIEQTRW